MAVIISAVMTAAAVAAAAVAAISAQVAGGPAPRPRVGVPTYSKDVAPILQKNCQVCHRPGEIGPFPLLTYSDARQRATEDQGGPRRQKDAAMVCRSSLRHVLQRHGLVRRSSPRS